jgi:anti-anti-sigma factor
MPCADLAIALDLDFNVDDAAIEPTPDVPTQDELGRRVEDWIVSTLDDRNPASGEADWEASLSLLSLAKISTGGPRRTPARETPIGGWTRFRLVRRRGITVVVLMDQSLTKQEDLQELAGDLLALVEAGHLRLVLDMAAVERLSSWAGGALADVVTRCRSVSGGALKVCGLRPPVASIFGVTGLDRGIEICTDASTAVAGDWPDLPEFRPLPVSVLSALTRSEAACLPRRSDNSGSEDHPPMTSARLIALSGRSKGTGIEVEGRRFVVGRTSSCQLRLGSAIVSRRHAIIERRDGRLFLRDLGSTNGTVLNGRALLGEEAELHDSDLIRFGPFVFALVLSTHDSPSRMDIPAAPRNRLDAYARGTALDLAAPETDVFSVLPDSGDEGTLRFETIEGVLVVTPMESALDDEATVDDLRDALLSLLSRPSPRRVVVSLAHVGHISGRAIGVLVAHHLRLDRVGGALRVCLANPRVAAVLEQVKLGMLVECHPNVDDAVLAAWPQALAGPGELRIR